MLARSFRAGLAGIKRRPGLAVLLYAANLILAGALGLVVYAALEETVGPTGFGADLSRGFDLVLWSDIFEKAGPALRVLLVQLLWIAPLYLLWKTAAGVGLVHALRGDQIRPFWEGVGRFTGRGLLLALLFLLPLAGWVVVVGIVHAAAQALWQGEVAAFRISAVLTPALLLAGCFLLDLMQDFGRTALVVKGETVGRAWTTGLAWPFRHPSSLALYAVWAFGAALLLALPALLNVTATGASAPALWGVFILQQVFLLLRASASAGWIGSETAYYEEIWLREMPLIAENTLASDEEHPDDLEYMTRA